MFKAWYSLNAWFDELPEPRRLFTFILIMFGWLIPLMFTNHAFHIIGCMWFIGTAIFSLGRLAQVIK